MPIVRVWDIARSTIAIKIAGKIIWDSKEFSPKGLRIYF